MIQEQKEEKFPGEIVFKRRQDVNCVSWKQSHNEGGNKMLGLRGTGERVEVTDIPQGPSSFAFASKAFAVASIITGLKVSVLLGCL